MVGGIDAPARAKARGALRGLLQSAAGAQLRRSWRPSSARRLARAAIGLCSLTLALLLALAGGLFYLLATGPINLESLQPSLTRSLEERLGDRFSVSIGPTFLMRGPSGLGLGFGRIQIRDRQGRTVVSAPSGRVGLDVLALLGSEVKVRRLELDGLDVKLRVDRNGGLSVAAAAENDAAPFELSAPTTTGTLGDALGARFAGVIGALIGSGQSLDRLSLVQGHLEVENEALGKTTVYQGLAVSFDRSEGSASMEASAQGPAGRWSFAARARGGSAPTLQLEARDFGLGDLMLLNPHRPPFDSDMPISFKFDAELTPQAAIASFQGRFSLGAGYFKLDDPDHQPFLVDEATGLVRWDAEARRFRFDNVEALAGASRFTVAGWIAPPAAGELAWRGRLQSHDSVYGPERPDELPVKIDDAVFEARFLPAESRFVVDRFTVHGPHLTGELTAEVRAVADGTTLELDLEVGPSALADLMRIWPSFINPDARNWCLDHIRSGELASGSMKLDWDARSFDLAAHKRQVPADSVHGEFAFRDAAVDLLPGVPTLTGVDASGFITGVVFSVTAKHGAMEFAPGRRMQATDIFFKVPDTKPAPIVPSQAGAHVQGSADALADLLSRDAMKHYAGFLVDPANVKGQFQGVLTLALGLGKSVRPEDQRFQVVGSLANLQLDKFLAGERFEQGALDVTADSGNLKIVGQGQINGLPAKVDLTKGVADDGALTLNLTIDDAARAKLGLTGGPPMTGPMGVRVKAPLNKSAAEVEVDLAHVEVDAPDGTSLKAAGRPGKATFTLKSGADGYAVGALAIDAGSLQARGTAQLGLDGALQNVRLSQLRLSAGDDLKLDLQGGPAPKAVVRGASFDARNLIKPLLVQTPASGGARDIDLDAKIARVVGADKQSIEQFELVASRRGGAIRSLQVKGQLGDGALAVHKDEGGALVAHVEDAGALAKFLDFYSKLEGGVLDLTLQDTSEGSRGVALMKKFTLREEPALQRLAAAGQLAGRSVSNAPAIDPDAAKFDRMTAKFTRGPGRLDVHEALIFNSLVGLTAQGYIDFAHDRVDLNGTFVPAYQVNSLVSNIPVVGILLGGAKHEGIFGVNYRITGPASGPTLNVNPLSGMTPGIFRKLFGAVDGTTPTPDSGAAQPSP